MHRLDEVQFPARVKHCAARLAQNDPTALAELFDLTAVRAVRFAKTITRNAHDAEDALQAAFVRMALYPRLLAHAGHPWAYVLCIVRNEALKIAQKKRADQVLAAMAPIWSKAPEEDTDARQFIQQALHKLPPSQAEVVVLKIWEGLTFAEIADVLGESPNTAASRYRYALEKLTKYLQPLADPIGDVSNAKSIAAS